MSQGPSFPAARLDDLAELLAFVDGECARLGVPEEATFGIRLAAEESFLNIIHHGYPEGTGPVSAALTRDGPRVSLTLSDRAPPFDPADAPAPDLESPADERAEGGLGWHLVRQFVDEVHHRPAKGGGNILTLVKHLGETDAD